MDVQQELELVWSAEAGFLVRVHPEPCLILSGASS
jgi:hypothetical protein